MAPAPTRRSVPKERFGSLFSTLKTQTYSDPSKERVSANSSHQSSAHAIRTISWNPTGHLIATGSQDRTLRIWNPDKPQLKNSTELRGHTGAIERVAWNPTKEAELASVSTDGTVRFWDVRSKACIESVQLGARGLSLSWAPDGRMVMAGKGERAEEEALVPISIPSFTVHPSLPQYVQTNSTIFAPVAAGAKDYTLFITTGNGTVKVATYPRDPDPPPTTNGTSDDTIMADAAPTNGTSHLDPTPTGGDAMELTPSPSQPPTSYDPHTSTLSSSSNPSSPSRLKTHHILPAHPSSCTTLSLSPTGRYLATGGSDAILALWDTSEWVCKRALDHCVGSIRSVSFSFDGSYIVAGSEECHLIEIVNVESGETVATVGMEMGKEGVTGAGPPVGEVGALGGPGGGSGGAGGAGGASGGGGEGAKVDKGTQAQCVAWHPSRYWIAVAGEMGGLRVVGAAGGVL